MSANDPRTPRVLQMRLVVETTGRTRRRGYRAHSVPGSSAPDQQVDLIDHVEVGRRVSRPGARPGHPDRPPTTTDTEGDTAMTTYHLQINGSSDASQASRLESNLRRLVGVTDAAADRAGNVVVRGGEGLLPLIGRALTAAGYEIASDRAAHRSPSVIRWYQQGWLTASMR